MSQVVLQPCPGIGEASLELGPDQVVCRVDAPDLPQAREALRGMYVDADLALDAEDRLAYVLTIPDRRLLLAQVPFDPAGLPEVARLASLAGGIPTALVGRGGTLDLAPFVLDLHHDWTGTYARAKDAWRAGRPTRALELLLPLLRAAGPVGLSRAFHLQGRCFAALGDPMAAVTCTLSAIQRATRSGSRRFIPLASTYLADAGASYLALGDLRRAGTVLRASLHLRPNNPEALLMYAGSAGDPDLVAQAIARLNAVGGHEAFVERFVLGWARATATSPADALERAARERVDLESWDHLADPDLGDLDRLLAELDADAPARAATTRLDQAGAGELTQDGAGRILRLLWHLAAVDGHLDDLEVAVIERWRQRLGVSPEEAAARAEEGRAGRLLQVGARELERQLLLDALIDVAAADGVLAEQEEALLYRLARALGLTPLALESALRRRLAEQATAREDAGAAGSIRRVYRILAHLAAVDGLVAPEEQTVLDAFRRRHGLERAEATRLEAQGRAGEELELGLSEGERKLLLGGMVELVAADGVLAPEEQRRVLQLAEAAGIPTHEVARALRAAFEELGAVETRAAEPGSETAATVVLLGLPKATLVADLIRIPVELGFRGFAHVPPGVHRFAVETPGGELGFWTTLAPGQVLIRTLRGGEWLPASPDEAERFRRLASTGGLDAALAPFPVHLPWQALTEPLLGRPIPVQRGVFTDPGPGTRLERAWKRNHGGDGEAFLAEVAFSFLEGVVGGDPVARRHWLDLVQAIYHCGASLPREQPELFVRLVELLVVQQQLLPREDLAEGSPVTFGSRYLAEDLLGTGLPALVAAGRRWEAFVTTHHGANDAPLPLEGAPTPAPGSVFGQALAEWQAELAAAEQARGLSHPSLLPILFKLGGVQELAGDLAGALASQRRMVAIAGEGVVSPGERGRLLERLARLCRRTGRGREAQEAQAEAHRLQQPA